MAINLKKLDLYNFIERSIMSPMPRGCKGWGGIMVYPFCAPKIEDFVGKMMFEGILYFDLPFVKFFCKAFL